MADIRQSQMSLFIPGTSTREDEKGITVALSDPSFAGNKTSPIHRWVPWIAGFSREFVVDVLDEHMRDKGTVLDPFAGVGTTLVEAMLRGHQAIGFEINPYAMLACKTKCAAFTMVPDEVAVAVKKFGEFYQKCLSNGYRPKMQPPATFRSRVAFFSPEVLRKVLVALDYIFYHTPSELSDLFRLAFGSVMVEFSNYSYEPSLSSRVAAGKKEIHQFPVGEILIRKLHAMVDDIRWLRTELKKRPGRFDLYHETFFDCRRIIAGSSVDLIVTSPPYLNNYHYNRNTRPHMFWLRLISEPSDLRTLEEANFGKYWQTVRGAKLVDLDFPNPPEQVVTCINQIRSLDRERGVYGGNGWANYAATYFNDCYRFAKAAKWVLRRRGTAAVVIGNNVIQGISIPTDVFLGQIAESVGLQLVEIKVPRETRVGNSIIRSSVRVRQAVEKQRLYEAVVFLRKR